MSSETSNRHPTNEPHDSAPQQVVPEGKAPCVWMEAGVLTWWICDRALECTACPLDAALRRANPETQHQSSSVHPRPQRRRADLVDRQIEALDTRARYASTHVWERQEADGLVRIGLDSFAAWVIGRIRCVILVPAGTRVNQGEPCAWLDQPGGTLTIRSPISGDVVETNTALTGRGDIELSDVFGADWLLRLRPWRLRTESVQLADAQDFTRSVNENVGVWRRLLRKAIQSGSARAGPSLPDGGIAVADLDELLGPRRHTRIAAGFLRGSKDP